MKIEEENIEREKSIAAREFIKNNVKNRLKIKSQTKTVKEEENKVEINNKYFKPIKSNTKSTEINDY